MDEHIDKLLDLINDNKTYKKDVILLSIENRIMKDLILLLYKKVYNETEKDFENMFNKSLSIYLKSLSKEDRKLLFDEFSR